MKKILITTATIAMPAVFALAGAGTAQANDDGLCWNGWIWSACIQAPGWVDWGHWDEGWGHDWDGGDWDD